MSEDEPDLLGDVAYLLDQPVPILWWDDEVAVQRMLTPPDAATIERIRAVLDGQRRLRAAEADRAQRARPGDRRHRRRAQRSTAPCWRPSTPRSRRCGASTSRRWSPS